MLLEVCWGFQDGTEKGSEVGTNMGHVVGYEDAEGWG